MYKPHYTGYDFMGWYDNEDFDGYAVTQIPKGSTGDRTFYAKWEIMDENGDGRSVNPFKIKNEADLLAFAQRVNSGDKCEDIYFRQTADIVVTQSKWTPIGNPSNPFKGNYNGDNHTISGIKIKGTTAQRQGLFGFVSNGVIKNVILVNSSIQAYNEVGGIVGRLLSGIINNCHVRESVKIILNSNQAKSYSGGIVGYNDGGTIRNCTSLASVTKKSKGIIGGIVGYTTKYVYLQDELMNTMVNCFSYNIAPYGKKEDDVKMKNVAQVYKIDTDDCNTATATFSVDGTKYYTCGTKVTISCTAPAGYAICGYTVNGASIDGNTFTMPDKDVTITALWKKLLTHTDITVAEISDQTWTGDAITPEITVKDGDTDITSQCNISYKDNKNTGTASVTITAKDDNEYYTGSTTRTFKIIDKVVGEYGALTITENQDGKKAILDEDMDGISIADDITGISSVTFNREFSTNTDGSDVYSTIILPFDAKVNASEGCFYAFKKVTPPTGGGTKWVADFSQVEYAKANKPYIFIAKVANPTFKFANDNDKTIKKATAPLSSPGEVEEGETESKWTFIGVYSKIEWSEKQEKIYGFAGTEKTDKKIAIGDFVLAGKGSRVRPFRCYLTYDGVLSKSTSTLPDRIEARIVSAVAEPDEPSQNPGSDITTPTSELSPAANVKVWSYDKTICIAAAPNTPYRIIDAAGRVLKDGVTATDRDEIRLGNHSGIAIVVINNKTFKVSY